MLKKCMAMSFSNEWLSNYYVTKDTFRRVDLKCIFKCQ